MFSFYEPQPIDVNSSWSKVFDIKPEVEPSKTILHTIQFIMIESIPNFQKDSTKFEMTYRHNGDDKIARVEVSNEVIYSDKEYKGLISTKFTLAIIHDLNFPKGIHDQLREYLYGTISNLGKKKILDTQNLWTVNPAHDHQMMISRKSRKLPGVGARVSFPCECFPKAKNLVWEIIIHLNDHCKWSREKIADWLDELHDKGEINIEFQPWGEEKPVEEPVQEEVSFSPDDTLEEYANKMKKLADVAMDTGNVFINTLDGWKAIGYTDDPIKIKFDKDNDDSIKFKMTQHFSLGVISEEAANIIKGDVL